MKKLCFALASALAILVAGTATAQVPGLSTTSPGVFATGSVPSEGSGALPGVPPGLPAVDPAGLLPGSGDPLPGPLGVPGLPLDVAQLLTGTAVVPGGDQAGLGLPPAPAGLPLLPIAPAPGPTAAEPQKAPAKPQVRHRTRSIRAAAAETTAALFPGLPGDGYAGFGTGTVIHSDALQSSSTRLADVEVAYSGATYTSSALSKTLNNEMSRIFAPVLAAGNSYGRGSGLEIGAAVSPSGQNQVVLANLAEAKAPPSTALVSKEVGPVTVDPAAAASLLRGQAQSRAAAACTTGIDLSYGLGYAANVGLLGSPSLDTPLLSTTGADPARTVSQSVSRTYLVPQAGATGPIATFGLESETRETIAPITFFKGQPQQFTIEFAGEWVLRATADGKKGSVFYGPGKVSPETPLLRIIDKAGNVTQALTSQEIFGKAGLQIDLPNVAEISIGEDPRAIAGSADSKPTETATLSSAAVDVVRVRLLDSGGLRLADVRVGHMEAATAVPAGGITCGIGLVKTSDKDIVTAGDKFTWTVSVSNPNDCVLTNLKLVDTITTTAGIVYSIISTAPKADSTSPTSITWNELGPLEKGQSKDLKIAVQVSPNSSAGRFTDDALATGTCGPAAGEAGAGVSVPLSARVTLNLPEVLVVRGAEAKLTLPRTGGVLAAAPAFMLMGIGVGLRRIARRRRR
jgi:uncharacterized repeat protein (TIGR01451 family)